MPDMGGSNVKAARVKSGRNGRGSGRDTSVLLPRAGIYRSQAEAARYLPVGTRLTSHRSGSEDEFVVTGYKTRTVGGGSSGFAARSSTVARLKQITGLPLRGIR